MRIKLLLSVASVCLSTSAMAQTERDLDSHLHGAAGLNVAIVESEIFLELSTPWNNLVGFEHAPRTDDQHALVDNALRLLNTPDELFSFGNSDCSLVEVVLEDSMNSEDDHHGEEGHGDEHAKGHGDEHAEGHDDEHGDEHAEGHDDEHGDEHAEGHDHDESASTHSTLLAMYSYQCDQIDQLDNIGLSLFELWPEMIDLDVQLVGNSGQTQVELNRANAVLDVTQVR